VVRRCVWSRKPQEWGGHDPLWVAAPQKITELSILRRIKWSIRTTEEKCSSISLRRFFLGGGGDRRFRYAEVKTDGWGWCRIFNSSTKWTIKSYRKQTILYILCLFSLTYCGRVTQICVFNRVKLGTSASSP